MGAANHTIRKPTVNFFTWHKKFSEDYNLENRFLPANEHCDVKTNTSLLLHNRRSPALMQTDKVRLRQKVPAKSVFAGKSNLVVCCNIISSARLLQKPRTGL
jgi:hypothetical protein